jgi:hypothetical protein
VLRRKERLHSVIIPDHGLFAPEPEEAAKPQRKTKRGAAVMGPSGVGVWTALTLNPERDTMYVTTDDNYSDPPTSMSDAVVAHVHG